jgi:hypothetical protein
MTLLLVGVAKKMKFGRMDIDAAYLNAPLDHEIYGQLPDYLLEVGQSPLVKLKKALYGLKQAGRQWNQCLNGALLERGWERSPNDDCLYVKGGAYLIVYVDDILIAATSEEDLLVIKQEIQDRFAAKDLGGLGDLLGISIKEEEGGGLQMSQIGKVQAITSKFAKIFPQSIRSTPCERHPIAKFEGECPADQITQFQSAVGSLSYVARLTRPDISTAVNFVARRASNPGPEHFEALGRIIGYLLKTTRSKLVVRPTEPLDLIGWSDASFATDPSDGKSQSGYVIQVGGATVNWWTGKQKCVTLSSMEAEYVALCDAATEMMWFKKVLNDLGVVTKKPTLFCDNKACIQSLDNSVQDSRATHINVKYHYVRELVAREELHVAYTSTIDNKADVLTKGLGASKFKNAVECLGLELRGSVLAAILPAQ